jgi:protein-glutamine gamma-glutamyltransferase
MLIISGKVANIQYLSSEYPEDSIEMKIIGKLASSKEEYRYSSINQFKFEVNMRRDIISSSIELNRSKMKFKTFKDARCNRDCWELTKAGGFKLREDISPAEGINDIYNHSSKYGTECSTAIVIVYYKAIFNIYPEELFNKTFKNILLLNWHSFDDDLSVYSYETEEDFVPGDCLYIENPDHSPDEQEWQGENVIDLGNNMYYGHGIGIADAEHFIKVLNRHRKHGAEKSAYLTRYVARPNFKHLADIYLSSLERMRADLFRYNIIGDYYPNKRLDGGIL